MRQQWLLFVLCTTLVINAGCSGNLWNSRNKFDEHPLSKVGQKKIIEDERERGPFGGEASAEGEGLFSIGGGEGLLGGGRKKTQEQMRADKLFAAALDVVLDLPIQTTSREGGFIATDWKVDPNQPTVRYRMNIRIAGTEPYGEVKVSVLKQSLEQGLWVDRPADDQLAKQIRKTIRDRSQMIKPN
ncbi:MAG: DUF3576 domain-containing protein [Magnetococcales bacterium]|nr:DUF3576 domain-containing protein [Magnetococcales bacterium]